MTKEGSGRGGEWLDPRGAPPLRATWSGTLSLGLVNIPVKAIPLVHEHTIHFRMIHERCRTPIVFRKVCGEGEEVPEEEIAYGYELSKGEYVILKREELERAKPESSRVVKLDSFIDAHEIDPHYFEKTYLLVPDRTPEAYALLREVMSREKKGAIGRITLHARERIVLVHHYRNALVATTLRWPDEVLDPASVSQIASLPKPQEEEIRLATLIVERLVSPLNLSQYRDGYRERLEELIRAKQHGETIAIAESKKEVPAQKLMEALKKTAESLR